jgi:hypothetical protein
MPASAGAGGSGAAPARAGIWLADGTQADASTAPPRLGGETPSAADYAAVNTWDAGPTGRLLRPCRAVPILNYLPRDAGEMDELLHLVLSGMLDESRPAQRAACFRLWHLLPRMLFTGLPTRQHRLTAELQARVARALRGDWRALLEEYVARQEAALRQELLSGGGRGGGGGGRGRRDRAPPPFAVAPAAGAGAGDAAARKLEEELQHRMNRVELLVRLGELSRAARHLSVDSRPAPATAATLAALRGKHPPCSRPIPPAALRPVPAPAPLVLEAEALRRALRQSPKGSSGGCDGWTVDHVRRLLLDDARLFGEVLGVCQLIAAGAAPAEAAKLLGLGRLIALDKAGKDVRPICVGQMLRRLTGRAAMIQLRKEVEEELAPLQLGISVSCGVEVVCRAEQAWLEMHPDHVMLFVDVRNAFNEVSRAAVFEALNESPGLRCLLPMFRAFYEETGTLWYDMGAELGAQAVESAEGTQQGDPGSGLAFALAIQGPLRRAAAAIGQTASPQTGLCVAIADDMRIAGPPDLVAAVFAQLEADLRASAGLTVNRVKTVGLSVASRILSPPAGVRVVDAATPPAERGVISLGIPQGHPDYVRAKVAEVFIQHAILPARLARYGHAAKQASLLLLRKCALPQAIYVLRCLPPDFCAAAASTLDGHLLDCLGSILATDFREANYPTAAQLATRRAAGAEEDGPLTREIIQSAAKQIALPIRVGGVGLFRLTQLAASSHVASVWNTQYMLSRVFPAAAAAFAAAAAAPPPPPPPAASAAAANVPPAAAPASDAAAATPTATVSMPPPASLATAASPAAAAPAAARAAAAAPPSLSSSQAATTFLATLALFPPAPPPSASPPPSPAAAASSAPATTSAPAATPAPPAAARSLSPAALAFYSQVVLLPFQARLHAALHSLLPSARASLPRLLAAPPPPPPRTLDGSPPRAPAAAPCPPSSPPTGPHVAPSPCRAADPAAASTPPSASPAAASAQAAAALRATALPYVPVSGAMDPAAAAAAIDAIMLPAAASPLPHARANRRHRRGPPHAVPSFDPAAALAALADLPAAGLPPRAPPPPPPLPPLSHASRFHPGASRASPAISPPAGGPPFRPRIPSCRLAAAPGSLARLRRLSPTAAAAVAAAAAAALPRREPPPPQPPPPPPWPPPPPRRRRDGAASLFRACRWGPALRSFPTPSRRGGFAWAAVALRPLPPRRPVLRPVGSIPPPLAPAPIPVTANPAHLQRALLTFVHADNERDFRQYLTDAQAAQLAATGAHRPTLADRRRAALPLANFNQYGGGAMLFLDAIPTRDQQMDNQEVLYSVLPALGVPLPALRHPRPLLCFRKGCTGCLDARFPGAHLSGPACGAIKKRSTGQHDGLQTDGVVPIVSHFPGRPHVRTNVKGAPAGREMDATITCIAAEPKHLIDVTMPQGLAATNVLAVARDGAEVTRIGERAKRATYGIGTPGCPFRPGVERYVTWAVAPSGRHGAEVKAYLRDMARKKAAHDMPGLSGGRPSASASESARVLEMAGIYYSRWLALSTVVAVRAHARFLQQCVQHCLEVAAPSAAEAAEAALPGGRAALWRAGGRGWEREFHSPPAVFSDMATSRGAADFFGTVRCSVRVGCLG